MFHRNQLLEFAICGLILTTTSACSRSNPTSMAPVPAEGKVSREPNRVEVISKVYDIDRIYRSMTGPSSSSAVRLVDSPAAELLWITGCHVQMVDGAAQGAMPEQFMCHANLDINVDKHRELFGFDKGLDGRLFTLSQGQLHVQFPEGFGIPVMSDENLDLTTQVLNLNVKDKKFQVRHRVHVDFVRDRETKRPYTPLYQVGVTTMVSLEGRELVYDTAEGLEHEKCKSCCLPGQQASKDEKEDRYGRKFTGHWVIKPGREVNHTRATGIMNLPFDTKIHYIAVHMHPFAESLELRDATADTTIFKSQARNLKDQIGLEHMDAFSSADGVPIYRDHEYELVSIYNNTTQENQDSMAVMFVYVEDREFMKPTLTAAPSSLTQASVPTAE